MNRIDRIFADLRARKGKALMPFVTAGDPDLATTADLLPAFERAGASICELGIAFSDPVADGPVIQESMQRALHAGTRPTQVLDMVAALRSKTSLGLVAMVSYSIVHRLGEARFVSEAAKAGIDGFIIPDLSLDESAGLRARIADAGLICSLLIAPTTAPQRVEKIAQACSGFIYLLARRGITGERSEMPPDLPQQVARLRQVSDLPIAVGFGVSSARHVREVVRCADAAIVGSAIVRRIADQRQADRGALVREVEQFVSELSAGLAGQ